MQGQFEYGKLGYYPHMKPADVHLWEKFLDQNPNIFDTCDYDYLVGKGIEHGDIENDQYARSFKILTQKKIDVVGYKDNLIYIIEVKPFAGSSALGQVISYRNLFLEKHPFEAVENIKLGVVTNEPQSDYERMYKDLGIELYKVGFCPECDGTQS